MRAKIQETIQRSITKAITFRFLILCSDGVIILAITHRFDMALGVIFFSNFASTVIYFLHERLWNKIKWGELETK
jgi:uncharacterized membrane protein